MGRGSRVYARFESPCAYPALASRPRTAGPSVGREERLPTDFFFVNDTPTAFKGETHAAKYPFATISHCIEGSQG